MDTSSPVPTRLEPRLLAVAAASVLVAGLLHTGLEALAVGGWADTGALLRWRVVPAALWAGAAPLIVEGGARWPVRGPARLPRLVGWIGAFTLWHTVVNLALRLPELPSRGVEAVLASTADGAVEHAPASLLLFVLLAALGQRFRRGPHEGRVEKPAASPPMASRVRETVLTLSTPNRIHRVPAREVRWLEADGDHVRVHADGGSYRVRGTLTRFQRSLRETRAFVRLHRSSLVRVDRVREVQPLAHGDWVAVLDDRTELRIPRTRKKALDRLRGRDGGGRSGERRAGG